jgi:acetyl-CoA carboxylase carboxyl transferase subunit alpha
MAATVLPFEAPVVELLGKVRDLRDMAKNDRSLEADLRRLETRASDVARQLFSALTPFEKVLLSRHPARPYTLDYIERIFTDWVELHGDRRFSDDASIVAGLARFRGRSVAVIGHQKGRSTKENVKRNFGMPHPEGYRKAIRLFEMADRFEMPSFTFIDTPGAYPGIGAEERGQSEAIGAAIGALSRVRVPVIATVIGEGGSGGALALGVANRVHMLEFGCYAVISPEGCAAILWKDGARAPEAAARMKMTPPDLLKLEVIDHIVDEPPGGAHQDPNEAAERVGDALASTLAQLSKLSGDELREDRYQRFRRLGRFQS